jgi:hypothetical protein
VELDKELITGGAPLAGTAAGNNIKQAKTADKPVSNTFETKRSEKNMNLTLPLNYLV